MPPKLQVDESFAFLFTCIEASGCKVSFAKPLARLGWLYPNPVRRLTKILTLPPQVDFKLVGDATDLQPAAARMRYTRLRKAVEAGHFKGATLTQPNVVSSRLSELANPQARRFGQNASSNSQRQHTRLSPDGNSSRGHSRRQLPRPISIDEEEEAEEEEEQLDEASDNLVDRSSCRKRRLSSSMEAEESDQELFFSYTPEATREKKIKCSESVVESDEEEEEPHAKKLKAWVRSSHQQKASARKDGSSQQRGATVILEEPELLVPPSVHSSDTTVEGSEEHHDSQPHIIDHQSANVSRKKQSANVAAEAAYKIGSTTGRFARHISDNSGRKRDGSCTNSASQLGYVGQGIHMPINKAIRPNTGRQMEAQRAISKPPHPCSHSALMMQNSWSHGNHGVYHPPATIPQQSIASPVSHSNRTTLPAIAPPVPRPNLIPLPATAPHPAQQQPSTDLFPTMPWYSPSKSRHLHPASVFDGFEMPTPRESSTCLGGPAGQNGKPLTLLQRVKMSNGCPSVGPRSPDRGQNNDIITRSIPRKPTQKASTDDDASSTSKVIDVDVDNDRNSAT